MVMTSHLFCFAFIDRIEYRTDIPYIYFWGSIFHGTRPSGEVTLHFPIQIFCSASEFPIYDYSTISNDCVTNHRWAPPIDHHEEGCMHFDRQWKNSRVCFIKPSYRWSFITPEWRDCHCHELVRLLRSSMLLPNMLYWETNIRIENTVRMIVSTSNLVPQPNSILVESVSVSLSTPLINSHSIVSPRIEDRKAPGPCILSSSTINQAMNK